MAECVKKEPCWRRAHSLVQALVFVLAGAAAASESGEWGPDIRLTTDDTASESPVVVNLANGYVGIVWKNVIVPRETAEILFMSGPDLEQMSEPRTVVRALSDKASGLSPVVDTLGRFHGIFSDNQPGNFELFHESSDDHGTNWSLPARLTDAINESWNQQACSFGNHLYVVWDDNRAGLSGWTFSPAVYFRPSYDQGATWGKEIKVSDQETSYAWAPQMLVDGAGTIHAIWHDRRGGALEIYYDYSTDHGSSWHEDAAVTESDGIDSDRIAWLLGPSGVIHLFWVDRLVSIDPGIYYRHSIRDISKGIHQWTRAARLATYSPDKRAAARLHTGSYEVNTGTPAIAFVEGILHLVWSDYMVREIPGGQVQNSWIYWMYSRDGGDSWSQTETINQRDNVSKHLVCAPWGGQLLLAWSDNRDGNLEIYGKAFVQSPVTGFKILECGITNGLFGLSWEAEPNQVYQVEQSTNLQVWNPARNGDNPPLESSRQTNQAQNAMSYRSPEPLAAAALHFRVKRGP